MVERTAIALLGGLVAALVVLVAAWILLAAYTTVGWQIPVAAGISVAGALWFVDWLSDTLSARRK